jgi:hypothetical protein
MPPESTPATTPSPSARNAHGARPRVALLVAGIWLVAAIPVVLGVSSCPVARLLHEPCPGCGMTRAIDYLVHGDIGASLAMHPLAVPTLLVQVTFALVTIAVSLRHGTPLVLWRTRMGRISVYAAALVFALDLILWLARFAGFAHGPVPVG